MFEDTFKELEKAQRTAKKQLKAANYKVQNINCCFNCKKSYQHQEEDIKCGRIVNSTWDINSVTYLGICDEHEPI